MKNNIFALSFENLKYSILKNLYKVSESLIESKLKSFNKIFFKRCKTCGNTFDNLDSDYAYFYYCQKLNDIYHGFVFLCKDCVEKKTNLKEMEIEITARSSSQESYKPEPILPKSNRKRKKSGLFLTKIRENPMNKSYYFYFLVSKNKFKFKNRVREISSLYRQ